ncbi:hypothetical protein PTKIN_Ptkin06aG0103400 [Pterospermum kingtungense]
MEDLYFWDQIEPLHTPKLPSETCSDDDDDDDDESSSSSHALRRWRDPGSLLYSNLPRTNNGAGISSGLVVASQTNVSTGTAQATQPPDVSNASLLKRNPSTLSESERVQRKRKTDQAYRQRCKADPTRLENEKLKYENASLRKHANLSSNLPLLAEENAKLKIENKVLKVQNDALCGKIISDNDKKQEQEQ